LDYWSVFEKNYYLKHGGLVCCLDTTTGSRSYQNRESLLRGMFRVMHSKLKGCAKLRQDSVAV